jgi:hypothetical protein
MQSRAKDVTAAILNEGTIGNDITKFRNACLSNPLVSSCDIEVRSIQGARAPDRKLDLGIDAAIDVKTRLLMRLKIDVTGQGRLDPEQRVVTITGLKVNNDMKGLVGGVLGMLGFGVGKTVKMARKDINILEREIG